MVIISGRMRWWLILFSPSPCLGQVPDEWITKYKEGRYMISTSNPSDGLFPSFSNGFLAGDAGCSNISDPTTKGGSCGRVNLAGVFNNQTYYDDDNAGTFPRRAAISNPYSFFVGGSQVNFIASALDLKYGKIYNRSFVPCNSNGGIADTGESIEIETSIWADQHDRNVLIFEIKALNLTAESCSNSGEVFIPLQSCSIGEDGTSESFNFINQVSLSGRLNEKSSNLRSDLKSNELKEGVVTAAVSSIEVWELEVKAMEIPPEGSTLPVPENTQAAVAFQSLPLTSSASSEHQQIGLKSNHQYMNRKSFAAVEYQDETQTGLIMRSQRSHLRFHAVFHSSIELSYETTSFINEDVDLRRFEEKEDIIPLGIATKEGLAAYQHLRRYMPKNKAQEEEEEEGITDTMKALWKRSDELHETAWDNQWIGGIEVEGNNTIALAINASLYNLISAVRPDFPLGISPGGLTHDAYEGHSFWDAETWMFPNLVALFPLLADNLIEYRVSRLAAAQDTARLQGLNCAVSITDTTDSASSSVPCAVWPWESALLGFGVSPWLEADAYEIHVAGDISMSLQLAFRASGNDVCFFYESKESTNVVHDNKYQDSSSNHVLNNRWPTISSCASFYTEKAVLLDDGSKSSQNYTFYNVIGPDESAGVVNSSAYTNAIASKSMMWAIEVGNILNNHSFDDDGSSSSSSSVYIDPMWTVIGESPYLPLSILPNSTLEGHAEYDGYHGEDINQADVALLQYPLNWPMQEDIAYNDLLYYEQRSSTSQTRGFYTGDSAYSIAWLRLGNITGADAQFIEGLYHIDLHNDIDNQQETNVLQNGGGFIDQGEENIFLDSDSLITDGFGVWKETKTGGNTNFITGAGGWLQNIIYGYSGLKYEQNGTLSINKPTLLPLGVTSLKLRGVRLGQSRFNMKFNTTMIFFELIAVQKDDERSSLLVTDVSGESFSMPIMFDVFEDHTPFVISVVNTPPSSCGV